MWVAKASDVAEMVGYKGGQTVATYTFKNIWDDPLEYRNKR